ncbi:MAG: NACHT domain-containing protein [Pyrinomonadaceae bacterium]
MRPSAAEQVIDFYQILFGQIFSAPFREQISNPLERNAVTRLVGELADAASQSLTLFFDNRRLKKEDVAEILESLSALGRLLKLEDVAQPGIPPETIIKKRLGGLTRPEGSGEAGFDVVYRLALQSVLENLLLIGPVLGKWQKFNFSRTYEPPRRIIERLNQNIAGLGAEQAAGQGTQDELYELDHRNYLLQRFERVEAGTVQMTTNMVDLQALFVMPRVQPRPQRPRPGDDEAIDVSKIMNLAAAREFFGGEAELVVEAKPKRKKDAGMPAFEQVEKHPRTVIVGVPGSGKSTFLEWLQLSVAGVRKILVAGDEDEQAIPLLLRVRELDAKRLPRGAELIEAATGSEDRAALMPEGWLDRQMKKGRVLFMLDGLDETDPKLRDKYLIPWLAKLCEDYPDCRYLVSSRPAGYPPGTLRKLKFAECDLLDFSEPEMTEYTKNWCTAIRLARSENEKESRRKGAAEGASIVKGFEHHPYIKNLARNPLMLSAVCLVNYFEDGRLPEDRARLYKLCVEGLLHHWDSRRGIHSDFTLDEKLRACRQVAIAMQADDRAEYEAAKVIKIFTKVLDDSARAKRLLEHIRYRTGLLIERRAGIFAFAHLTFQEYLAACAVHEGNHRDIGPEQLAREHADARWNEVIALYCGIAPTRDTRNILERLIEQEDTVELAGVLAEAYLSSRAETRQDQKLRRRVIERIAIAPSFISFQLNRFPEEEVAPIANACIGKIKSETSISQSHHWLREHTKFIDETTLAMRLSRWQKMTLTQTVELIYLLHRVGSTDVLIKMFANVELYSAPGPTINEERFGCLAEVALIGLSDRKLETPRYILSEGFLRILRNLVTSGIHSVEAAWKIRNLLPQIATIASTENIKIRKELASLSRQLAMRLKDGESPYAVETVSSLNSWADSLERTLTDDKEQQRTSEAKSKKPTKRAAMKAAKRRG